MESFLWSRSAFDYARILRMVAIDASRLVFLHNSVTFGLNVRLDLSGKATTKSLSSLGTELMLQVLGERAWIVRIRMICGDEGVGDIPGVQGVSGEPAGSAQ